MNLRQNRLVITIAAIIVAACAGKNSTRVATKTSTHPVYSASASGADQEGPRSVPAEVSLSQQAAPSGASSFKTPIMGESEGLGGGSDTLGPGGAAAGDTNSTTPTTAQSTSSDSSSTDPRTVEESDIYAQQGNTMYVLNHYRGLEVIDLTNLNQPALVGRVPIYGYPIEMYLQGTNVYALVSDYYEYWGVGDGPAGWFHGSQVWVIDVSNPAAPAVLDTINVDGNLTDSRIVGNIMYVVSTRYSWWDNPYSDDDSTETLVLSIDISNPMSVQTVQTQSFPQGSWAQNIYTTPSAPFAIYVATVGWNYTSYDDNYYTNVQYVDINDPGGSIVLRGSINVPGQIPDRWSMDEYNSVLRTASGQSWGNGDVYLNTYSVSDPDNITQLGQATITVPDSLQSAAFDGNHGYLISSSNVDALYSFDLSNPQTPAMDGALTINQTYLDYCVPQGDTMLALGNTEGTDANGNSTFGLSVSLIDTTPGQAPSLIQSVPVGSDWGWVPSTPDDYAKVFKVLPTGMIMLPFQSWDETNYTYVGGVQLIDYSTTALTLRGLIGNAGDVERGIPLDSNTVVTLADDIFQVMDITDQDNPTVISRLELSRDVQDFQLLANGYAVQLSGDWTSGDTSLAVTAALDPDDPSPISEVHVPAPYGRMFVSGNDAYVVSMVTGPAPNYTETTVVQVFDFTNPAQPVARGSVTLPQPVWPGYHSWYWGYGDQTVMVNGTTLAFFAYSYDWWYLCDACDGGYGGTPPQDQIYLVDLSNPDAPVVASTTNLTNISWAWGMNVQGATLNISSYVAELVGQQYYATYNLQQVDISNIYSPRVMGPVNVPGQFVSLDPTGQYVYSLEQTWDSSSSEEIDYVHVLQLWNGAAYLQGTVQLPTNEWLDNIVVVGTTAYVGTELDQEVNGSWTAQYELLALDLSVPSAPVTASTTLLPYVDYAFLQEVSNGTAFFSTDEGILTYSVSSPTQPTFGAFYRTEGWADELIVDGSTLFVPSGDYGVHVIPL